MRTVLVCLSLLATIGCAEHQPLRIGAKDFSEQRVLAEMVSRLLKDAGWAVEPVVSCGDTYACYAALQAGDLDLLVDYTGTGFVFRGDRPPSEGDVLARLNELYEPLALTWMAPLGFDNSYIVVVRRDQAVRSGVSRMSQLSGAGAKLSVACPREFLRRPLDGLQSMLSRYGLAMRGEPMVLEAPEERVAAVLEGRADVAVLYGTDGAALEPRIVALEDDLDFFPSYEAAFVVRNKSLKNFTGLGAALARLEGRVDRTAMRHLNQAVQMSGLAPAAAANNFLVEQDLLANPEALVARAPDLVVAVHPGDGLQPFEARVLAAVRKAWPRRQVAVSEVADPVRETVKGNARMALLGGERFFHNGQREERLEAVVALGLRRVHPICRKGVEVGTATAFGVQDVPGLALVLKAGESAPTATASSAALLAAVKSGELDCALVLAETGAAGVADALRDASLELRALPFDVAAVRRLAPFLRPVRIPANTYPGQQNAVETVGTQVLLAGPGRLPEELEATGGPATAMPAPGQPVPAERVQALVNAAGYHEAPDPVLPSAWGRSLPQRTGGRSAGGPADAVLNGLVFLFIGWLVYLVFRRQE